ncbi:1-deoxy-D-xylulose 5-phosphate reductoisomerase [Synergistales bacterium]|nr:1-deoxy-D-xylulose 5-phosphate reductoisomerase [Synergistales bacterium]
MKNIAVIGATGSVGGSVLDICARYPDKFRVSALAARSKSRELFALAKRFGVKYAALREPSREDAALFASIGAELLAGDDGLMSLSVMPDIDHVSFSSSGTDAIPALIAALSSGKEVSLANKESVVAAGQWVMPAVRYKDQLRPVDSEHSAVWQCLSGEDWGSVEKIYLTASGGPFLNWPIEQIRAASPEDALRHPVWAMGPKITVDSATLMNKGIECVEAMRLFSLPHSKVGALIHPGSRVHGVVSFSDAAVKLLYSQPDMRLPAACALSWPERLPLLSDAVFERPDFAAAPLIFSEPDEERFPCFKTALEAGRLGGAYPALLIGADEFAVRAFLDKRIPFGDISVIVEKTLERWSGSAPSSAEDAIELIAEGERLAREQ